jgi:predicted phage terminase large subunit-like protein
VTGDISLNFKLLPWQKKVWNDPTRFKIVAAGRRTGKSRKACYKLITEALEHPNCDVFYIAPTQGQARDIMWNLLLDETREIRTKENVNNLQVTVLNGSRISLKGSDRPDTMRGVSLQYVVLDEYADMKPDVWSLIIRPALSDRKGGAMFIGTPMGRNHFFELYCKGREEDQEAYKSWNFTTYDNPLIDPEEIESAKNELSSFAFRQEYMASFEASGSEIFQEEWIQFSEEPQGHGDWYIAADLAGFERGKNTDNSAIAVVKVNEDGWWVKKIEVGCWSTTETAEKIFNLVAHYKPVKVGIERGIAKQAVMQPLQDLMRQRGKHFIIYDLTHGNQRKTDRIRWALEGKFEHGKIKLNKGKWNMQFLDELFQFPDTHTHDDMIDALAYVDQLADTMYGVDLDGFYDYEYEPLDEFSGF